MFYVSLCVSELFQETEVGLVTFEKRKMRNTFQNYSFQCLNYTQCIVIWRGRGIYDHQQTRGAATTGRTPAPPEKNRRKRNTEILLYPVLPFLLGIQPLRKAREDHLISRQSLRTILENQSLFVISEYCPNSTMSNVKYFINITLSNQNSSRAFMALV